MGEPASRLGHGIERAKYNQCRSHGLPPASLDEVKPTGRIERAARRPQGHLGRAPSTTHPAGHRPGTARADALRHAQRCRAPALRAPLRAARPRRSPGPGLRGPGAAGTTPGSLAGGAGGGGAGGVGSSGAPVPPRPLRSTSPHPGRRRLASRAPARSRARLRAACHEVRRGPSGRGPRGVLGPDGPCRRGRAGDLRGQAGRAGRGGGQPRVDPHDLRAGPCRDPRGDARRGRRRARGPRDFRQPLRARVLPALGTHRGRHLPRPAFPGRRRAGPPPPPSRDTDRNYPRRAARRTHPARRVPVV